MDMNWCLFWGYGSNPWMQWIYSTHIEINAYFNWTGMPHYKSSGWLGVLSDHSAWSIHSSGGLDLPSNIIDEDLVLKIVLNSFNWVHLLCIINWILCISALEYNLHLKKMWPASDYSNNFDTMVFAECRDNLGRLTNKHRMVFSRKS